MPIRPAWSRSAFRPLSLFAVLLCVLSAFVVPSAVAAVQPRVVGTANGSFTSLTPTRLLDTRNGTGAAKGAVAAVHTVAVQVEGVHGIPSSGVAAVAVNVTVAEPAAGGYITVYADGAATPTASSLNFARGQIVPNLVIAPVGADGKIVLYNGSGGTVQLVADVSGYYLGGTPSIPGSFGSIPPTRALDTRIGTGSAKGAVGAAKSVSVKVTGLPGVPSSGVSAVAVNVTVTQPTVGGFVTVYADGATKPTASNLNFVKGQTIANLVMAPVGSDGAIKLTNSSGGTVQLVADVAGYYLNGTSAAAGAFGSIPPARVLDTRNGTGAAKAAVGAAKVLAVQIAGTGGVPLHGVSAVAVNVTVTAPAGAGYLTVYADGATRTSASNLNFVRNQVVPNLVIAPVGADGKIALYNGSGGTVQLIADVAGYYLNGTAASGVGNDVSYPQCGSALPTGQAFAVVGLNDGTSPSSNPCFSSQLSWAQDSFGGTPQPKAALYINTQNPGIGGSFWPTSNQYPAGTPVSNPYGTCAKTAAGKLADTVACAYIYGYAKAYDEIHQYLPSTLTPSSFTWWLDVEISNSWETNLASNVADLEGMVHYLKTDQKLTVGIYSTSYQWGQIAGTVATTSNLSALPNWLARWTTLAQAQAACKGKPLMTGKITMTQYLPSPTAFDYDNSCT